MNTVKPTSLQDIMSLPDPILAYSFDLRGIDCLNPIGIMAVNLKGKDLKITYLLQNDNLLSSLGKQTSQAELVYYDRELNIVARISLNDAIYKHFDIKANTSSNDAVSIDLHFETQAEHKGFEVTELYANGASIEIIEITYECGSVSFMPRTISQKD